MKTKIKILFDYRHYQITFNRGIGRYILALTQSIINNDVDNIFDISILLYKNKKHPQFINKDIKFYFIEDLEGKDSIEQQFDFWFFDSVANCFKIEDCNFFDFVFLPFIRYNVKKIVGVCYDLTSLCYRKDYLNYVGSQLLNIFNYSVFDYVFFDSESAKNDFLYFLPEFNNNVLNIYGGIGDNSFIQNKEYSYLSKNNDIIFVSDNALRKNTPFFIKAFALAYNSKKIPENSKLYIVFNINNEFRNLLLKTIKESNLSTEQVVITGYISDEELLNLYQTSKASFFPSLYEGLGMPVLESYQCGCPCFASNTSSLKEITMPECQFDPYDLNSISNSIIEVYNNEDLCKKSIKWGQNLLKEKCNWDVVSKKVINKLIELNDA